MNKSSGLKRGLNCFFSLLVTCPVVVFAAEGGTCKLPAQSELSGKVELDGSCTYTQSLRLPNSNTHLDCKGATLDGGNKIPIGIVVGGGKKKIENVTVENCRIQNFKNRGISITSGYHIKDLPVDREANYKLAPSHIMIDNVTVSNSGRGGVYFDSYTTESTLKNSTVQGSGNVGVYLEQGTQRLNIVNNTIQGNGKAGGREGLSVDSSAHNTIEGNRFIGNTRGGVLMYKNCGEHYRTGKSALRWQSSDFNTVRNNTFTNERVGVWIASRQGKDLSTWGCGDPAVDPNGKYYKDYANNNIVEGNQFCNTKTAVRVEGDNNKIMRNRIDSRSRESVLEPYKHAKKPDGQNTQGNTVESNDKVECSR
ncbi:NosD domain-containing protein [Pseudomonas taetrolens]|uniref:NosD domain-containing protein n=1 Tax=Pseudomonas taetrolens TaxID=47884 RepID=UPI0037CC64F9